MHYSRKASGCEQVRKSELVHNTQVFWVITSALLAIHHTLPEGPIDCSRQSCWTSCNLLLKSDNVFPRSDVSFRLAAACCGIAIIRCWSLVAKTECKEGIQTVFGLLSASMHTCIRTNRQLMHTNDNPSFPALTWSVKDTALRYICTGPGSG